MSCYISSNDNRLYASTESTYGTVSAITGANRFPAVRLSVKQSVEKPVRRDKTGSRSFLGLPAGMRKRTNFELRTYLTTLPEGGAQPGYNPLFQAAMGKAPIAFNGGTVASSPNASRIQFAAAHGLVAGQAIAVGGEVRFVTAIVDPQTVDVNAPFSVQPAAGAAATPAITYMLGKKLPSASLFDYWSPAEAVQRIVSGAAVDEFEVHVNGDFHEFKFRGPARDVIDNATFTAGQGGLAQFPAEPEIDDYDYSIVPGHLGQVWLGATPERFYTLTAADVTLENAVDARAKEFGLEGPRCIIAGQRKVNAAIEIFASDNDQTKALYQAARQGSPIQMMFQLGQKTGQIFGLYMKNVVPDTPHFDDSETRLAWKFAECRAQGTADDELVIAFA